MPDKDMNETDVKTRGLWSNRFMFILAAAGSAIGLGNIWRFPYLVGKYGGGAFVLVYLFFILIIGLPILVSEIMIGRQSRRNPVGAFKRLADKNPFWMAVGFLGVASGFVILSYYSVVAGWTVDYFVRSVSGDYLNADLETINNLFNSVVTDGIEPLVWHTVFMAAIVSIVIFGVKEGLERWIGILMPLLFLLLIALVIYGLFQGDAAGGLGYLFVPDWSSLYTNEAGEYTAIPVLEALGQAFFTLSLGMGAMITYGSYLGDDESLSSSAVMVAGLDTLIAILAGIAIYTILFQYNLDPAQGPGLVFKVLPLAFSQMPGGQYIGTAFFLLLSFAALTSGISLLEVVVAYFIDDRKWKRTRATLIMGAIIWGLGVFSALSYSKLSGVTLIKNMEGQGMPVLDSIDRIANNYMLPLGGLFIALFGGWFMKRESVRHQLIEGGGTRIFYGFWKKVIRYVTPVAVALLLAVTVHDHFTTSTGVKICDRARGGDLPAVKKLVEKDKDRVKAATEQGWTALHFSSRYGHDEVAEYLIEKGAPVDARSAEGATPLLLAAKGAHAKIIEVLLEAGASPEIADEKGRTPLHMAAAQGDEKSAVLLLQNGASVNERDKKGETPLHYAARHGYKTVTKLLLKHGADVGAENQKGFTPLELPGIKPHRKVRAILEAATDSSKKVD
ncbi:MAG: sodium-dependent transporter [bacterium]